MEREYMPTQIKYVFPNRINSSIKRTNTLANFLRVFCDSCFVTFRQVCTLMMQILPLFKLISKQLSRNILLSPTTSTDFVMIIQGHVTFKYPTLVKAISSLWHTTALKLLTFHHVSFRKLHLL